MLKRLLLILCLPLTLCAQNFPAQPTNYVTDVCGLLSANDESNLNKKLKAYQDSTSTQFFVYITDSLRGQDMSQLCQEIFHAWKIGSEKNNGLLIAVFVKDHKFRIHSGYGLEGALPDLAIKRVQDNVIKPAFKAGNYYQGLDAGIDALINAVGKEFIAEEKNGDGEADDLINAYAFNGLMLIIIFLLLRKSVHSPQYKKNLRIASVIFALIPYFGGLLLILFAFMTRIQKFNWLAILIAAMRSGNSSSRDYSSSEAGSSSDNSDSSSDSSFDGGGGGDSGGGGSDSSW